MEKEEKAAATAQEGDFSSRLFRFLRRFISAEKTGFCYCEVCEAAGWVANTFHSAIFFLFSWCPLTQVRHDEAAGCEGGLISFELK